MESFHKKTLEFEETKKSMLIDLKKLHQNMEDIKKEIIDIQNDFKLESDPIIEIKANELNLVINEAEKDISHVDLNKVHLEKKEVLKPLNLILNSIEEVLKIESSRDNSSKKIDLITRINLAKQSFEEFLDLEQKKSLLQKQATTLEKIVLDFSKKQKIEMNNFLSKISEDLNYFYSFMNEGERIDCIRLATADKDDEFSGIALNFKFYNEEIEAPKHFLSESQINCLGLSLFLSSVKLFNQRVRFIILDDVISSFDKHHRFRFSQLLQENFSDYQLIVLTHERDWFEMMSSEVKGKGWHINEIFLSDEDDIEIKIPLTTYREKIDKKIQESEKEGLGNLLRKYAEKLLKELSIELKFPLKSNEQNEKRTLDELYDGFIRGVKEKSNVANEAPIKRLRAMRFFGNRSSHDGYKEELQDLKPIYADLKDFEEIFKCVKCNKFVSLKFYNQTEGCIACKCGAKKLRWK